MSNPIKTFGPCHIDGKPSIARCYKCNQRVCEDHSAGYVLGMNLCNACFVAHKEAILSGEQPLPVRVSMRHYTLSTLLEEARLMLIHCDPTSPDWTTKRHALITRINEALRDNPHE